MNREETNASGIVGQWSGTISIEVFYDSQTYFGEGSDGDGDVRIDLTWESTGVEEIEMIGSEAVHEGGIEIERVDNEIVYQVGGEIETIDNQISNQGEGGGNVVIPMGIDLIGESRGVEEIEIIDIEDVQEDGGEIERVDNETVYQVGGEIETIDNQIGNQGEGGGDVVIPMVNIETGNQVEGIGGVVISSSNGTLPIIGGAFPWFHDKGSVIFVSLIVCVLGQVVCSAIIPWYTNYRPAIPPPVAFVFPFSPSPSFPPSLPLSRFKKYHDHAMIIGYINFMLSGLALVFVWLTLAWKEKKLNESVGTKDILRFSGHFMVFMVRFGLLIYAVFGGRLNTIDLTCIPFVMELISNFLEMRRRSQQSRLCQHDSVDCFCFVFLLMFTLAQGMISAYLPWTNNQTLIFPILNCALAVLMLGIAVVWFYLKFRRDPGGSMKEKMRVVAYSIVFAIRVGIVIYAVMAKSHGMVIYSFDLSCIPFLSELYVIYLELKSPPVRLAITH